MPISKKSSQNETIQNSVWRSGQENVPETQFGLQHAMNALMKKRNFYFYDISSKIYTMQQSLGF